MIWRGKVMSSSQTYYSWKMHEGLWMSKLVHTNLHHPEKSWFWSKCRGFTVLISISVLTFHHNASTTGTFSHRIVEMRRFRKNLLQPLASKTGMESLSLGSTRKLLVVQNQNLSVLMPIQVLFHLTLLLPQGCNVSAWKNDCMTPLFSGDQGHSLL